MTDFWVGMVFEECWKSNRIDLLQTKPVSLLSARDKLPFEITPFMIPSRMEPQAPASR